LLFTPEVGDKVVLDRESKH